MKRLKEHAYGIIPLKRAKGRWCVLLVQHRQGHWAFPKGRPVGEENPKETAVREFYEETGLSIKQFLPFAPIQENYAFQRNGFLVDKSVSYYLAIVTDEKVCLDKEELMAFLWVKVDMAKDRVTFPEAYRVCIEMEKIMNSPLAS